uniref:Myosin motor domain-containing protein n=1 Tax=Glossina pallidipes TaxID=7398 RepID=A0A1A9ZDK9_GLOPL
MFCYFLLQEICNPLQEMPKQQQTPIALGSENPCRPGERNYHVLYQLIARGQKNEMAKDLQVKVSHIYRHLNASGDMKTDVENEANTFEAITMDFTVLQIPRQSVDARFKVISAILWVGNLQFVDIDEERCEFLDVDIKIFELLSKPKYYSIDKLTSAGT